MKKKLIIILSVLFLLIPIQLNAIVDKSNKEYVTDEAEVLSEESENYIVKYSDFLYKAKKINFYVVTVKNLDGMEIEDYTEEVYGKFKIKDKGIIILLSKEDRKIRIQVGNELLKIIDNELIDEYIDTYFMPYMKQGEWNDGIINGYSALYKYICEEYGIDASTMEVVDKLDFITKYKMPIFLVIIWIIMSFASLYKKIIIKTKKQENKVKQGLIILLVFLIITNIFAISISYILEPVYLLLAFAFEGYALYSNFHQEKNKVERKVKRKRVLKDKTTKKKKKRIKKH